MVAFNKSYERPTVTEITDPKEVSAKVEQTRIASVKDELVNFSQEHNIRSLEDRVKRGLDPVGIVALKETDEKVHALAEKLEVSYDDVLEMVLGIQLGGPWKYAKRLKEAQDPATKIWIMLNAANTIGKEREMDMTDSEFIQDLTRIDKLLDDANNDPDEFFHRAQQQVLTESQKRFRVEDGVPISEMDNGFIAMSTNGYESGIIQDADGLLFVGAEQINDNVFDQWGLKAEQRDDGRGRMTTFYVNDKGEAIIKKLYEGFVIVLSRNFQLAKAIVKASSSIDPETLGQKIYRPTSMPQDSEKDARLKPTHRVTEETVPENLSEDEKIRAAFYNRLAFLKTREIFRDKANVLIRKMREKGKGRITNDTLESSVTQTKDKVRQKMEELQYMISIMDDELRNLPPEVDRVVDMAGGAGDLGLAVSLEMLARGKNLTETDIVDPVEELAVFNRLIVEQLPDANKFKEVIKYKALTLQEAEIPPNAIVVAKHACGDLTDTIIEKWVQSQSPLLVIMTCCQDKAQNQPARYNISQDDWRQWCKDSSKTNSDDPKKLSQGMDAMTKLDEARVNYLRRYGFDAKLIQTDKFPKGDVIIARRVVNRV